MSHAWDSGVMVRKPSWHRLEKAVLEESPKTWEDARTAAGLTWDVETETVYTRDTLPDPYTPWTYTGVKGWQALKRSDNGGLLSIQPQTYEVVRNERFGEVIDALLSVTAEDDPVDFEALMSLYGGKQIVALVRFEQPLQMTWDPSKTFLYICFVTRHDGNGGLRGLPTNVRVQCANTLNQAEMIDGRNWGFTIRHTSNWEERLEEIRTDLASARGESQEWLDFAEQLALWKAGARQREAYLKKFLPISDDMGQRAMDNVTVARDRIRQILESDSCTEIAGTGYGLLMASTEWADHHRDFRSNDSYVSRQLLTKQAPKARAASILRTMAKVK